MVFSDANEDHRKKGEAVLEDFRLLFSDPNLK
jgi:hypothetical protein